MDAFYFLLLWFCFGKKENIMIFYVFVYIYTHTCRNMFIGYITYIMYRNLQGLDDYTFWVYVGIVMYKNIDICIY